MFEHFFSILPAASAQHNNDSTIPSEQLSTFPRQPKSTLHYCFTYVIGLRPSSLCPRALLDPSAVPESHPAQISTKDSAELSCVFG